MNQPSHISRIRQRGITIYTSLESTVPDVIPNDELENILRNTLVGFHCDWPQKTRAKIIRQRICETLGYPVPRSFARTRPKFPSQNFDVYIQVATNLQIWNAEIVPDRRYVLVLVDSVSKKVCNVKVLMGEHIAKYDRTGTLTTKFQASYIEPQEGKNSILVSRLDTKRIRDILPDHKLKVDLSHVSPTSYPTPEQLIPIENLYNSLKTLVGSTFSDPGPSQERRRGDELHRLIERTLGYGHHADPGSFPDIPNQLLEIKLQLEPTIDLGFVLPSGKDILANIPAIGDTAIARHCDVRYAVFRATTDNNTVNLVQLVLVKGEQFFEHFRQFGGRISNRKIQMHLPKSFWNPDADAEDLSN